MDGAALTPLVGQLALTVHVLAGYPVLETRTADAATQEAPPTDANLVTAIDVSGSIDRRDQALQFDGIANAIVRSDFLQIVAAGYYGRVGFAVFTWSSQGDFTMPVPWSLIDSAATAQDVATRLLDASGRPRLGYHAPGPKSARRPWRPSLATDISAAIDHATSLLANAPFTAARQIINIVANGIDNVAPGAAAARNRALARGFVINGLVLGDHAEVATYLRTHVRGGPGSFVLQVRHPADFAGAMRRKFLMDLVGPISEPSRRHPARSQLDLRFLTHSTDATIQRNRQYVTISLSEDASRCTGFHRRSAPAF